mgnify:CR=1 FL=1
MQLNNDIQMNDLGQAILHKTPCYMKCHHAMFVCQIEKLKLGVFVFAKLRSCI